MRAELLVCLTRFDLIHNLRKKQMVRTLFFWNIVIPMIGKFQWLIIAVIYKNWTMMCDKFLYPLISCLHFLHQLFIPRRCQLILTALFTNELYILWQIPQALILINSDALTLGMNPVVTLDAVHHLRIKVIVRVALVTKRTKVVLFPLTPAVLAMCKFKHPQRFRIL